MATQPVDLTACRADRSAHRSGWTWTPEIGALDVMDGQSAPPGDGRRPRWEEAQMGGGPDGRRPRWEEAQPTQDDCGSTVLSPLGASQESKKGRQDERGSSFAADLLGKERLLWSRRQVEMHTAAGSRGIYEERKPKVKWLTVEERKGRDAGTADSYYESDPDGMEEPCGDDALQRGRQ
ncbi:hypothetical protein EYF80_051543 [Liparis tanakae]|uniref:Uncharacterized protein n=1 Tax=Liparis tanakae TaxID=230148 RepID=A0A4Z2FAS4_9TELE|nr:hypothetical protein EYF80_051543 [Liparis tanakae]